MSRIPESANRDETRAERVLRRFQKNPLSDWLAREPKEWQAEPRKKPEILVLIR